MSEPNIVHITGKTPFGDLLFQSAPNTALLHERLCLYFIREVSEKDALKDFTAFQAILNRRANQVPELNMYEFEANQRVYEIAVILMISSTINKLYGRSFIPAWQGLKQEVVMEKLTGKGSWDGFIYENPDNISMLFDPKPIEIKSTMIDPTKDIISNPNQLLKDRLQEFKDYFQSEGSINTVFIMPYTVERRLSINLKDATVEMNKVVSDNAMGSLCLLSFPKKDGDTIVTMNCFIVSKDPIFGDNGNIDNVNLTKMSFGKIASNPDRESRFVLQ